MSYTLFGTKLNNAYLALGILSTAFAGAYVSTRGDKNQAKPINVEQAKASVPVQAGSSEEEKFILDFIKEAEKDGAAASH